MEVCIVCHNYDTSDKILPRLARVLATEGGWKLSGSPDPHVDLNHFVCYIDYAHQFYTWKRTHKTAWFTHYEIGEPEKVAWWENAAVKIDVRLASADQYVEQLSEFGRAEKVTPPVDRDAFSLTSRGPISGKPIVGLSGFVNTYTDKRKGMNLVRALLEHEFAKSIKLKATGKGWEPVQTQYRSMEQLPDFYHSIDILLCTSLIEGIPMPPLEALSCGVSVVIPTGVGLLDELPEMPGIHRYPRGDIKGMVAALQQATETIPDRQTLRATTEKYTARNWADEHAKVFESLVFKTAQPQALSNGSTKGVYYVAYGGPARKCVKTSIESLREFMPDVPCAVASHKPIGIEDIWIDNPDEDIGGRSVKTQIWDLAPAEWERVLYLDADTELIADVSFLFDVLADGWDLVICTNPSRFYSTRYMVRPDNGDECEETYKVMGCDDCIQYNGGVFAFQRNKRTEKFFHAWHDEWNKWGKRDQAALLRALWKHPLRIYLLPGCWNTILNADDSPRYDLQRSDSAGILHRPMLARRHVGIIQGRLDSQEAWGKVNK